MGNFERTIPEQIKKLDKKMSDLEWSKRDIDEYGHDCDCDFCDRQGDGADPDASQKLEKIDKEIADLKTMRQRLVNHAAVHHIAIEGEKMKVTVKA